MPYPNYTSEEIARRGREIYDRKIRDQVEPQHKGSFVVIDVETEEYELDADEMAAVDRAKAKREQPPLFLIRVGFPTAVMLGGGFRLETR